MKWKKEWEQKNIQWGVTKQKTFASLCTKVQYETILKHEYVDMLEEKQKVISPNIESIQKQVTHLLIVTYTLKFMVTDE